MCIVKGFGVKGLLHIRLADSTSYVWESTTDMNRGSARIVSGVVKELEIQWMQWAWVLVHPQLSIL